MRYAAVRFVRFQEEQAYYIYISDSLQMIAKNTAKNGGQFPSKRYLETITPQEKFDADEIVKETIANGELVVI